MAFKIKDGVRIGTIDVFNNQGELLVNAPNVTGTVAVANGGTGQTSYTNGQLLIGNTTGNTLTKATLTAGTGITVTNGTGSITIANDDRGSSQNIFKNIANSVGTTQFSAATNTDSIRFASSGSASVSFDAETKTVTIGSSAIVAETDTLATVTGRGNTTTTTIITTNSTASTNTTTGALRVTGGVGVGGDLNVGGAISTTNGNITTGATTSNLFNTTATTLNIGGAATTLNLGAGTGTTTVNNNLVVSGNLTVNGTSTTIQTATLQVEDQNIELGKVNTPSNATANGGGITLLAGTDGNKTWNWVSSTGAWTSSEHINVASVKEYRINGTAVLSETTLGSGVTASSLKSVGTLVVGTWDATTIAVNRGGTGQTSYTNGELLIGNTTGNTLAKATLTAGANITITNGAGSITIAAADTTYSTISEAEVTNSASTVARLITGQRLAYAFNNITAANAAKTSQSVTFNNAGSGAASGTTFDGSTARTISHNTIGAVPTGRTFTFTTNNGLTGGAAALDLSANRSWTFGLTGQALALHNLASDGIIARTGAGTVAPRTITAGADISVTNGTGVAGNPTIANTSTLSSVTGRGATTATAVSITNSTASTSTSTGALIVSGGIGVAGNVHVGGDVRDNVTHSTSKTATVATTTITNVDTFPLATYRSGRYLIQITQGSNYQMSELRIIHNGTTTYITEYSVLETNGELGDFTADISGADVRVRVTMKTSTSAAIKLNRMLITV